MPKHKSSLQHALSKIKISHKNIQFPLPTCRHPKTPSFSDTKPPTAVTTNTTTPAVTLSDIDNFLRENFKSLYQNDHEDKKHESESSDDDIHIVAETTKNSGSKALKTPQAQPFHLESPRLLDPPPPENLCGSARFFVASGSSSSLITDADVGPRPSAAGGPPDDFIAVLTYSPSPYDDFRRSMEEMVAARVEHNGRVDWEFMQELLFCYLDLNNKQSYRFILRAFVDLVVNVRENNGRAPAAGRRSRPWGGGGFGGGRRWMRGDV